MDADQLQFGSHSAYNIVEGYALPWGNTAAASLNVTEEGILFLIQWLNLGIDCSQELDEKSNSKSVFRCCTERREVQNGGQYITIAAEKALLMKKDFADEEESLAGEKPLHQRRK